MSSLTAAQNPLDPREALVFFYSRRQVSGGLVTNLGVYRRSLVGGENHPYRDFNIESSDLRLQPAGLVIAFYNGAPRVFGFSQDPTEEDNFIVTQLSPTWTPIDDVQNGLIRGDWRPAIAAISDFAEDSAYIFYLEPETVQQANLIRYDLSKYSPQFRRYTLEVHPDSRLAAVKMRSGGQLRVFFQPSGNANQINSYDLQSDKVERILEIECWQNSPIAVSHVNNNEGEIPQYLYLYYVDTQRRIIRLKYSYESRLWLSSLSQVGRRVVPNFVWLAVVPVEAQDEMHVFYIEETGELVQLTDNLTIDTAPTAVEEE